MNAAKDDDIGISLGGFLTEPKRVSDKISDILNLLDLVIMSENDGLPLSFESKNLSDQIGGMGWGESDILKIKCRIACLLKHQKIRKRREVTI